ncbi:MAG: hypothetical protein MI922_24405, partial [Bacteroidales bacterium]|nr:hypothetical protein [Bacteroidales bacterium]
NDKLKGQMLQLMKDFAGKEGWKAEIGGIKIVDRDWNIERNEITGIILNRWIAAQVYIKYNDGICKVCRFVFEQNHNGSDYSEYLSHNAGGKIEEVDCE